MRHWLRASLPTVGSVLLSLAPAAALLAQDAPSPEAPRSTGLDGLGSFGRKAAGWVEDLQDKGFYPRLGSLCPNSGVAPGLAYWKPEIGGLGVGVFAAGSMTFRGDHLYELSVGRVPHPAGAIPSRREGLEWIPAFEAGPSGSRYFLYGELRRLDVAQGGFLNGSSDPMSASTYEVVGGYRVTDHVSASLRTGFLGIEPGQGAAALRTDLTPELTSSPAMAFRHDYFRVAGEIALDTRDVARNPHSGQFASALFEGYDDRTVGGSFRRATLDLRHFQALGSPRHVLALRALGVLTATADGTPVPFYLQRSLGGNQILRSYEAERFSGNKVLAFSAEYRFELRRRLELAAFYDVGRASDGHPSLLTPGFVSSYGVGARIKSSERILLRLDVARGREGMRTNATIGYSF